ncbi:glycolipid transfer protein [Lingula anatina]|uniref:Glycolipid transfer protein n=1 Tax=Lingula anatina TaxID=7574 RepID=A0A1S3J4Q0_LINAN|nr:glycolipid transfer protein [Lingula anatina]|eukprot:XP_013405412.1 glycolipid transfer protein [Lingula anatina]
MTFFSNFKPPFPQIPDDGLVETAPFLTSARQILPFFDAMGTPFKPVKLDIEGNVIKLEKKYAQNPDRFRTLYGMLEQEIQTKTTQAKESASTALLWLKRALQYTYTMLKLVHDDPTKSENMVSIFKQAYEQTLKRYHNWFVMKLFTVMCHAIPYRKDLIKSGFCYGKDMNEEQVMTDLDEFLRTLAPVLDNIDAMLKRLNLDSNEKV